MMKPKRKLDSEREVMVLEKNNQGQTFIYHSTLAIAKKLRTPRLGLKDLENHCEVDNRGAFHIIIEGLPIENKVSSNKSKSDSSRKG